MQRVPAAAAQQRQPSRPQPGRRFRLTSWWAASGTLSVRRGARRRRRRRVVRQDAQPDRERGRAVRRERRAVGVGAVRPSARRQAAATTTSRRRSCRPPTAMRAPGALRESGSTDRASLALGTDTEGFGYGGKRTRPSYTLARRTASRGRGSRSARSRRTEGNLAPATSSASPSTGATAPSAIASTARTRASRSSCRPSSRARRSTRRSRSRAAPRSSTSERAARRTHASGRDELLAAAASANGGV